MKNSLKKVIKFPFIVIKRLLRGIVIFPILILCLLFEKVTDYVHVSGFISKIPFKTGIILRNYFYRLTLNKCGKNVKIAYGSIISYKDTILGENVYIGTYNILGTIEIKDNVIIAQGCHFVSGRHNHGSGRLDIPITEQENFRERITVGPDVWFGANCTTAANVGKGCIIGAGSVVINDIPDWSVAVGNPAKVIKSRKNV